MKTKSQVSLWIAVSIIAVLFSPTQSIVIYIPYECESMLVESIPEILTSLNINVDEKDIKCSERNGNSSDKPQLWAELGKDKFQFFAFDTEDMYRIQKYRESGMGLDIIHIGNVNDFQLYLCPLKDFKEMDWKDLPIEHNRELKLDLAKRIKAMSAKNIYPQFMIPSKIYYNESERRVALMSDMDLQTENPKTIFPWMRHLFKALKDIPVVTVNYKNGDKIKKLQNELTTFVETPTTDPKYIDNLIQLMEKVEQGVSLAVKEDTAEFYKLKHELEERNRKDEEADNVPTKIAKDVAKVEDKTKVTINSINSVPVEKDIEVLKIKDQEMKPLLNGPVLDHTTTVAKKAEQNQKSVSLETKTSSKLIEPKKAEQDQKSVPLKTKTDSKLIEPKNATQKLDLTPYIVGVVVVVLLMSIVVAAVILRKKTAMRVNRNELIA